MLKHIPLLDVTDCERVASAVSNLRDHWIPRTRPPTSFFTLGVASYMDLSSPAEQGLTRNYYEEAPIFNALILDRFGWLLKLIQDALNDTLGLTTCFCPRLAVPGFHIFEHLAIPTTDLASIHSDLQYQLIQWGDCATLLDFRNPVSFTLPIKLPAGGGGINEWDLTYEEMTLAHLDLATSLRSRRKSFQPYSIGSLALHSGHYLHQIAGVADVQPGDQRITLQGHGLRRGTDIILYW